MLINEVLLMEKLDNRVRYTKMILKQALLTCLQKKNIDKVTIKEICETANINRGTFYLHYTTPNDLLLEIEKEFIDENMEYFSPYFHDGYETSYLAGLFTSVLKNKELCRIIMGKNGNPKFLEKLQLLIRENIVDGWHKDFPKYNRQDLDYVFDYIFAGSMRLILNWLEDENSMTTEILANRLDRLGHYCHKAISEFSIIEN